MIKLATEDRKKSLPWVVKNCLLCHVKKCLPCNVKRCLLYHVKNSLPCGCKITLPRTHNIAYEIRLQQALEENLLCPFHYFGITDLQIDGETVDEETGLKDFNKLTSDDRVRYVIEQIEYYGHCGKRPKGLVFCSSKKEAGVLSEKFNERGYRTLALTGDDSLEKREQAVERLVLEDGEDKLDYIFTVDIFNEGVDIPEVNQVIMLRPTESPIHS